ncbi:MAG: hypothetical protein ACSLFO_00365 [Acidimicrobiales bacterium]
MNGLGTALDARAAVERGEWMAALELLDDDTVDFEVAERLELRAQAAYGAGEFEAAVSAWEDLHGHHVRAGELAEASRAAAMVSMYLMMDTGLMAAVRGWLRRAENLLTGLDECPTHAVIEMVRTYERFMCGDMEAARQHSAAAIELGERLRVTPATIIGRVAAARVRIFDGDVQEGVDLLDEVAVLLSSPDVDPLTTGMMYCELICAAQGLALHERAAEWTEVMERWRHGAAIGGINGRCRVHRAEMLRFTGPCDAAEEEALAACEELRPWMRREFGWPLVELATIRLRKGDLDGAEEAYLAAHEHGWFPQPGLALLRLEQGDTAAATALIAEAIAHPVDIPSKERPPFGDLRLAPLLEAQAEIAAAAGDAEVVATAAQQLRAIADTYASRGLDAGAQLATARAALVAGDLDAAAEASGIAIATWADIRAPFETGTARLVLGEVHHRSGNHESAQMEWKAAAHTFETFGARRWAERATDMLEHGTAPAVAIGAQTAIFRCEGDTRTVCFGDHTAVVRDLKGFRQVERLLAEPGREFHVLDLIAAESGSAIPEPLLDPGVDFVTDGVGAGLPVLDDQARGAYRRRLAEVDEDIEDARCNHDIGRLELAERDREYLVAELQRAVGLGGAARTTGGTAERARTSVTRSIRYALGRLAEHHPALAVHLEQRVHTGTYCCYAADPLVEITWEI